jgi:putative flippase GtrA
MKRFWSFLIAGSLGFALDAGLTLLLLYLTPVGPLIARVVGIAAALGFRWIFNRIFPFGRAGVSRTAKNFRGATVVVVSTAINYAVYACLLLSTPNLQPLAALVLASACGALFGVFGSSRFVFRHHNR